MTPANPQQPGPRSRSGPPAATEAGAAATERLPGGPAAELESLSYEQARAALEEVVNALEVATVTLEESLALWERGNRLADIAQAHLDGARERIATLRPDLVSDNP
jgi:exodeoxyribonuclease VII small subunit